jgi:hypothetical protein
MLPPKKPTPERVCPPPRARWGRDGLRAALGPRWTRGRTGDAADAEGGARRVPARARAVGAHAGRERRGTRRDPTRVARRCASSPARAAHARPRSPGDAPEPRPDGPPVVWARRGSPEGGGPWGRPRVEGHPAAPPRVQARSQPWRQACTPAPRWCGTSWWGTPPCRRHGRLRGMTCAVLVASGAPRRLRRCGEAVGALEHMSSG